jgi:DNA-binding MarR family transcriptional regulator
MTDDQDFDRIDASLIRMRRLLELPRKHKNGVELSAVLVVDTIARRTQSGMSTRIADIALALSVEPSTASRLVRSTEAAGHIQRSPSPDDPRSVILHLTPSGLDLDTSAREYRATLLSKATQQWDQDTTATFARLLDEFSRAAADSLRAKSTTDRLFM